MQKNSFPCPNLLLYEAADKKVFSGQPELDAFVTAGIRSRSDLETSV
jgi:hypothetical protein